MKQLTAKKLLTFLLKYQKEGNDLSKIVINHRPDRDSDVELVRAIEEDLYDEETNSTLESFVLINNTEEPKPVKKGKKGKKGGDPYLDSIGSNYGILYNYLDEKMIEGDEEAERIFKYINKH